MESGEYTEKMFTDTESISLLENILASHRLVMPVLSKNDKLPDTDGYLVVLNENKCDSGRLDTQVKSLCAQKTRNKKGIPCSVSEKNLGYFSKIRTRACILIGVDRSAKKAYWKAINPEEVKMVIKQNKKTIYLPSTNEISYENQTYYSGWMKICNINKESRSAEREVSKKDIAEKLRPIIKIQTLEDDLLKQTKEINAEIKRFIDKNDKSKYFYSFIDFSAPLFVGSKGQSKRKLIRVLLGINEKEEVNFLRQFLDGKSIEQTGSLIVVLDKKRAREGLNDFFGKMTGNVMDKIIKLLLEYE